MTVLLSAPAAEQLCEVLTLMVPLGVSNDAMRQLTKRFVRDILLKICSQHFADFLELRIVLASSVKG